MPTSTPRGCGTGLPRRLLPPLCRSLRYARGAVFGNHAVDGFGQRLERLSLLDATDSATFSVAHSEDETGPGADAILGLAGETDVRPPFSFAPLVHDRRWAGEPTDISAADSTVGDVVDAVASHEVTVLHDMLVHANPAGTDDLLGAHLEAESYADFIAVSVGGHRDLIERLRSRSLYDETLFIVCADHGERLPGDQPADGAERAMLGRPPSRACRSRSDFAAPRSTRNPRE